MTQLIKIQTEKELLALEDYISNKNYIAFDVETDGIKKESRVIGFSICAEQDIAYYVALSYWDISQKKMVDLETVNLAPSFMQKLTKHDLIMHNGIFDCWMCENNYKVSLINNLHTDTMILSHLLDENRSNKLKELAASLYSESEKKEQEEVKESVIKNGGKLTKKLYELYKADPSVLAKYGAKDAALTFRLFEDLTLELYKQGLEDFFYKDESMPLFRGPTYQLNTVGLRVDVEYLSNLKSQLEADIEEARAFIQKETEIYTKEQFPEFNINSNRQLAWLLYFKLENDYKSLTDAGREICKFLGSSPPYSIKARKNFLKQLKLNLGTVYEPEKIDKSGKVKKAKVIGDGWDYISVDEEALSVLAPKYKWLQKFLELKKNEKLLSTYVLGIQERVSYGIIRPSFFQHGTTSGRYSSASPNFQNLPREDKRIKTSIVARPGRVFVGADYSQLEPRVFASVSGDETLMKSFEEGKDFYSVVGAPIFEIENVSMYKNDENSFAKKHPKLRGFAKQFSLATPYGTSAAEQSRKLGLSKAECQDIIDKYFKAYPRVKAMMLESHEKIKKDGVVYSIFGRPRRVPEAKKIPHIYGSLSHKELPYNVRTMLNLGMNHRVQSSAASIMNRAAIAIHKAIEDRGKIDPVWKQVKIVLQVHDELVLEGPEGLADDIVMLMKDKMENTTILPGVKLEAEPKIGKNLAELK